MATFFLNKMKKLDEPPSYSSTRDRSQEQYNSRANWEAPPVQQQHRPEPDQNMSQSLSTRTSGQRVDARPSNESGPTPDDMVIAVMGITGAGKTTFIQQFSTHDLNVGHGLESCTSRVDVIPCQISGNRRVFLIDTPGFDDTYRSDTEILRDVADWLSNSYQNMIRLTGIIYLHRISDVRIGGSGMKNLRMFRKLCGDQGLGSVVLATTMWSLCPMDDALRREDQLVKQNDLWKYLLGHGARVFRQDDGAVSGQQILDYLIDRRRPVTLAIQREMVDQGMKLSETDAGREVQEELEQMKLKHEQEMREIRQEMEEAVREKDHERQAELREYQAQIDRQMKQAAAQARQLEASREQLRKEMEAQHAREMQQLRSEVEKRQEELKQREQRNLQINEKMIQELRSMQEKTTRMTMAKYQYNAKFNCPGCGTSWLYESNLPAQVYCRVCRRSYRT